MYGASSPSCTSPGMPMSAMTMSPAGVSAGGRTIGIFGEARVTVRPASIDGPSGSAESADSPDGRSIATTGMPDALTSATTDSMNPEIGALRRVPKIASTISVQSPTSETCSSQAWLAATSTTVRPTRPRISRVMAGAPEPAEDFEVDAGVAADVLDAADQEHRDFNAALPQGPRHDEAVAAVVAA